jgi:predicted nuclease of predicted toxin-antitoxin system
VKFLVDQNRSPRLAQLLREAGHDAVHTLERGLEQADDDVLLDVARDEQRIVISGDTDFGALLALARQKSPSVILFRSRHHRTAEQQAGVILEHINDLADDLTNGAVAVITDERIRVRRLPLLHNE